MSARMERRFAALADEGRAGLVTFLTAGDPDAETSAALLAGLPAAGADILELGMPFSDPMADGPTIQAAGQRAIRSGACMQRTLSLVRAFRDGDGDTPVVLMGYFNPIYRYGCARFVEEAETAGVDGVIVVDLPPEEDEELRPLAARHDIALIRLVAPTGNETRLARVVEGATGFLYCVAVSGTTGSASAGEAAVRTAVTRTRAHTDLPVAVGFGIKTPEQAAMTGRIADAVVVGSALVQRIADNLDERGRPGVDLAPNVLGFASELGRAVRASTRNRS